MKLNLFKIFVLLTVLISGCGENKKTEPSVAKTLFNIKGEQAKEFYFVGKDKERIGVNKYNFEEKKVFKFWTDRKEKVILLSYSPNLNHIYFLTAKYFGVRSTLPYIKRIKLYSINLVNKDVVFVDTLMNGTQINADWMGDNSFKIIINSRDLRVSEYMNKHTFIYNATGKKLLSEIETINFIKKGYPLPRINNEQQMGNKNYKLQNGIIDRDSLFLFDKNTEESYSIVKLNGMNLNKISWRDGYVIFTIKGKNKNQNLIIYSLEDKSILRNIADKNIKNFLVFGNYLVYDFGLSFSSSISIFNLKKSEIRDTIKINGGCGLRNTF